MPRRPAEKPLAYEAGGNYFSPVERAAAALAFVSPDLPRDEWVRVGMALKSEFGEDGFVMFDEWSRSGQTYDPRAVRDTWKSIKSSGGTTIATLFHLATDAGWKPDRPPPPPPPPDPKKIERAKREELRRQRKQASAAGNAEALYKLARPCQAHPYLKAKGVEPVKGLRTIDAAEAIRPGGSFGPAITSAAGRLLVVPILDEAGAIQSLEVITGDGAKGYLEGAKKSAGLFVITERDPGAAVFLAEGLATGQSVHAATGARVHIAFDAPNLRAVAEVTRRRFPDARIVVAGDRDESGAGQKAARSAARAVGGLVMLPDFGSVESREFGDWNDLHQAGGLEVVTAQITAALAEPEEPGPGPVSADPPAPKSSRTGPYSVNERGLWYADADGNREWVCAPLWVDALTRNDRGESWGRLLRFGDPEGREHLWACPIRLLAGDGVQFRELLMEQGLVISPAKAARAHLAIYVQTAKPGRFVHCAEQTGWCEVDGRRVFVLGDTTLGETATRVLYQGPTIRAYGVRGNLTEWQDSIGRWCAGNSRLALAVSMAFAGPLLGVCGAEGRRLHFGGAGIAAAVARHGQRAGGRRRRA